MLVALDKDVQIAAKTLEPVPAWFAEWEQQLSRFLPDSELSRLNRTNGAFAQQVSEPLWLVLQVAISVETKSDGLVSPLMLTALEAAGYTQSFAESKPYEKGAVSSALSPTVPSPLAHIPLKEALVCNPKDRTVRLAPGVRIDLGGIAKGWAAEQTMERIRKRGPVLVDAGGDIAISGPRSDGQRWAIAIADPHDPDSQLELLLLRKGGVATSGRDYRRWQQHGVWQHHIIDPRTGCPAETDVVGATVIAPTTVYAEWAAKVVLLMGSREGLAWLEQQQSLAGVIVNEDGTVWRSRRLRHYTW